MLYKELRAVGFKMMTLVAVYGCVCLTLILSRLPFQMGSSGNGSVLDIWFGVIAGLITFSGILGGNDLIAEEKGTGTLSFLLTKPISRSRIYANKIGVNLAVITVPFILATLPVLATDVLTLHPIDWPQTLTSMIVLLTIGAVTTCLSGFISILARNTPQAMLITLLTVTLVFGAGWLLNQSLLHIEALVSRSLILTGLGLAGLLALIAGGLFIVGAWIFNTKEF